MNGSATGKLLPLVLSKSTLEADVRQRSARGRQLPCQQCMSSKVPEQQHPIQKGVITGDGHICCAPRSTPPASLQELMYAMDHILDALERGGWVYVNDSS